MNKTELISAVAERTGLTKSCAARMANNPATGGKVAIPAAKVPAFKPGKQFKDEVNKE